MIESLVPTGAEKTAVTGTEKAGLVPTGSEKMGAMKGSMSAMPTGKESMLGAKKANTVINANGTNIDLTQASAKAEFAQVLAKAKAAGTYDGQPIDSEAAKHKMAFDQCKVDGLTPEQQCKVVNTKFNTHYQPYATQPMQITPKGLQPNPTGKIPGMVPLS